MPDNTDTTPSAADKADPVAPASATPEAPTDQAPPSGAQADTSPSPVPPAGSGQAAQPSPAFMAKVDALLSGKTKVSNPASSWALDQIKASVGEQQQAQQQLQQLNAALVQAKSAADISQGKLAALLQVLEHSEAEGGKTG